MATTYIERLEIIDNPQFLQRVQWAIYALAIETLDTQGASADELTWAANQITSKTPAGALRRTAVRLMQDATVGGAGLAATDAQIQTVVDTMLVELAGA